MDASVRDRYPPLYLLILFFYGATMLKVHQSNKDRFRLVSGSKLLLLLGVFGFFLSVLIIVQFVMVASTTTAQLKTFSATEASPDIPSHSNVRLDRVQNHPPSLDLKRHSLFDHGEDDLLVQPLDYIYHGKTAWGASPVILESHKLIFFTVPKVGCTIWYQLFRRIMGYKDWKKEEEGGLPWNPRINGLKRLYHYNRHKASQMMTSPEWIRAIFVREPKVRFVSAYFDKAVNSPKFFRQQCCPNKECDRPANPSPSEFLDFITHCGNSHWNPQHQRMEDKYWKYITFVGHMESAHEDAKRLLTMIQAWDEYGSTGWGKNGTDELFQDATDVKHHTNSSGRIKGLLSNKLIERLDRFYAGDYLHPVMNITKLELSD